MVVKSHSLGKALGHRFRIAGAQVKGRHPVTAQPVQNNLGIGPHRVGHHDDPLQFQVLGHIQHRMPPVESGFWP